jgi:hypothetical protein
LPWPVSKSFPLSELPPLSLYFRFFSVLLFCVVLRRCNSKLISVCQRNPSVYVRPTSISAVDLHWHWFLLCMHPQFCIWDIVRPKDLKKFPKALVYKFPCGAHVVYKSTQQESLGSPFAQSRYWKTRARLRLLQSVCLHGLVYFSLYM